MASTSAPLIDMLAAHGMVMALIDIGNIRRIVYGTREHIQEVYASDDATIEWVTAANMPIKYTSTTDVLASRARDAKRIAAEEVARGLFSSISNVTGEHGTNGVKGNAAIVRGEERAVTVTKASATQQPLDSLI